MIFLILLAILVLWTLGWCMYGAFGRMHHNDGMAYFMIGMIWWWWPMIIIHNWYKSKK